MAAFDPDAYLHASSQPGGFDPNAYLGAASSKTTSGDAFGRGMMTGATFNFYDELTGLARAGGLEPDDPDVGHAIKSLIVGGYRKLTGDSEAERLYDEQVKKTRGQTKQMETEHPVASVAGNVAGSLAVPVGAVAQGATLPVRMGRGALAGAGIGAVSGIGAGEDAAERGRGALTGAGIGAVTGAAAPAVVEGVIQGTRALTAPITNAVRGAVNPESEAARRVVTAVERDIGQDPAAAQRLTPQEFSASRQGGGPAAVMDLGGETTRALARSAANTSPEGRQALNTTIDQRYEGQSGRITDWLRDTFHYPDVPAQQRAIEQTAQTVNRAAYGRAMRDPGAQSMWDEGLQQLTAAPAVREAIRAASTSGANRAAAQGFRAPVSPFQFAQDGTMTMKEGVTPSLQFWDQVKKNLDGMIGKARRAGDDTLVNELQPLKTTLVNHLDDLVPTYAEARAGAAHFFGAENALEAGQNFVGASQRFGLPAARDALAAMSPQERQLFQDGYVSRLVETVNKTGDRRNVLNQISSSPAARQELRLALGPRRAEELEAGLRVEGIMDLARRAVQGNSTTARQLAELGLAGGAGGLGIHGGITQDPRELTIAALMGALVAGRRHVDQRVARRVAEMLVSDDPGVLQRGVRVIAGNDRFMQALRGADLRLANAGGQQSANVPALQAAGVGRTNQNDQNVPRPPGQ